MNRKHFIGAALVITAVRILYLIINQRNLDVEEAQYWNWSQHLAMGYHSKPPMISWVIYGITALLGDQEWAIRLFSPVSHLVSALFLYGCGKKLYDETIGSWSGLAVLLLPGVAYSATISSTDPLLILFWSIALFTFIHASQTDGKMGMWIMCGVAIGFGLLSKYTMLAFLFSAALYIAFSRKPLAAEKGPYVALALALVLFLPNVIWNVQHHNAALHHVVSHNVHLSGLHFHWKKLGAFALNQVGLLGPVLLVFLILACLHPRQLKKDDAFLFLICFTAPMFILICGEALLSRAYGNWAAVAYPSGIILTVAYLQRNHFQGWLKFGIGLNAMIVVILYAWELTLAYGYVQWPQPDRPNWQDFGAALQKRQNTQPQTRYLVNNRELWSKMMYYGKIPQNQLYVWDPHHKADWVDDAANAMIPPDTKFVFITFNAELPHSLLRSFKQRQKLDSVTVTQRLLGREKKIDIYEIGPS